MSDDVIESHESSIVRIESVTMLHAVARRWDNQMMPMPRSRFRADRPQAKFPIHNRWVCAALVLTSSVNATLAIWGIVLLTRVGAFRFLSPEYENKSGWQAGMEDVFRMIAWGNVAAVIPSFLTWIGIRRNWGMRATYALAILSFAYAVVGAVGWLA